MMDNEIVVSTEAPLDLAPLDSYTRQIAQQILDEQDIGRVKDLTTLFNLSSQKRNVMRVIKMNDLLDKITDQVVERFEKTPDNFSNDDLVKYMQVTESAIEKANKQLNLVDETPAIQLHQNNQVNVNIIDSFDRESRERIADVLKSILSKTTEDAAPIVVEALREDEINGADKKESE